MGFFEVATQADALCVRHACHGHWCLLLAAEPCNTCSTHFSDMFRDQAERFELTIGARHISRMEPHNACPIFLSMDVQGLWSRNSQYMPDVCLGLVTEPHHTCATHLSQFVTMNVVAVLTPSGSATRNAGCLQFAAEAPKTKDKCKLVQPSVERMPRVGNQGNTHTHAGESCILRP